MTDVDQEIIKVREGIRGIGVVPKVYPLKLFLDMVPSSSRMLLPRCVDSPRDFLKTFFSFLLITKYTITGIISYLHHLITIRKYKM